MPGRPFGHAADLGDAGPGHGFLADGDAVADRLAVIEHVIEIVIVGIDHDRAGRFLAVIFDDGAAERLGDRHVGVADLGQQFLVVRLEIGLVGRLIGRGLHAARQHQAGSSQNSQFQFQRRHCIFQSKGLALAERQYCAQNATIPLIALSSKSATIPELRCCSRDAGAACGFFAARSCGFRADFWASRRHCRIAATPAPSGCRKPGLLHHPQSSSACQNRAKSCWVGRSPCSGVPHVLGVRPLRNPR